MTAPIPTWRECYDAGMSATRAAKERGRSLSSASDWAKRNGVKFRDGRKDPARAEQSAKQMRELHAKEAFAAAHSGRSSERMRKLNADPAIRAKAMKTRYPHIACMTPGQRADYYLLKRFGHHRNEALAILGIEVPA